MKMKDTTGSITTEPLTITHYLTLTLYRTNTVIYFPVANGVGMMGVNCTRSFAILLT